MGRARARLGAWQARLMWVAAALLMATNPGCGGKMPADDGSLHWDVQLPPQEHHPFLFFDEADRERVKERLTRAPWGDWWKDLKRHGVRSTPAVVWWLTGDEAAARKARADLLDRPIWRQEPQGYLEPSSHRFADYVAAYDVLAAWEGLTAGDHQAVRKKMADEADHCYGVLEGVTGGANYGNQRTLAASALGMAALTLAEYRDSQIGPAAWLERALYEIGREENLWFFRPGGHFVEGVGYTNYMNVQFVPFAIALERATGTCLFEAPRFREWLTFAAYQMQANGELIPWGTCESGVGLGYYSLLSNARYGRDLAPLFNLAFNLPARPRPHLYHIAIALARYDPEVGGERPPASRAFPASQTVVLREDWGHATVTSSYQGCTVRRTLALVRGHYVVVANRTLSDAPHDYVWQVRSACPPGSAGTVVAEHEVTWPGLSADGWRDLEPGRTQLTTAVPDFAALRTTEGRWRRISSKPEYRCQVAMAEWHGAATTALFVLMPNLREGVDVACRRLDGQDLDVTGPGWVDRIEVRDDELHIRSDDGSVDCRLAL